MIRALAILLSLAGPVGAQTPVAISAANDLRVCLLDAKGFRDATRLAQLQSSIEQIRAKNWGQVTEIAPGVFRMLRNGTDRTVEIKLPDASGAAHCMAFGPSLGPGQGAMTADKFVELRFLTGLVPAPAPQGVTRRYRVTGAPYQADLIAYPTAQGDVVGFTFSGVPQGLTARQLSRGDASVAIQNVRTALSNAVDVCLRLFFSRDTVEAALDVHGFDFAFETGGSSPDKVYFTPDNAVSVQVGQGTCYIETNYIGPAAAVQIAGTALNAVAPGTFTYRADNNSGCGGYYAQGRIDPPVFLTFANIKSGTRITCIENGTSRITISVVG